MIRTSNPDRALASWLSVVATATVVTAAAIAPVHAAAKKSSAKPSSSTAAASPYQDAVNSAYAKFKDLHEGKNADYIPALAKVDPKLYGIALVTVRGTMYEIGNAREEFSIQSVSKPFTAARVIESAGPEAFQERIGVNATGQKFNSILAIELQKNLPSDPKHVYPAGNPLVNAGAIATVGLLQPAAGSDKWSTILGNLEAFAGRRLAVNDEVYRSESETNTHNRAIVQLLNDYEVMSGDLNEALDLYTKQCSVSVSARDLAVMGATLANGGRNPLTDTEVVSPTTASKVLAILSTAGLYETTGEWLYKVGVPAKSGVGGGIVAVVPGRFAVGTFAPRLDPAGNSVRGQRAIEAIMRKLSGNVFAAVPISASHRAGGELGPASTVAGGN